MARNSLKSVMRLIDIQKVETPPETAFLNDLKRSIELTDEKNRRKPSQSYKPSSMNCIRNMYYQIIGAEPDKENSSYTLVGICNSGSDIHERIQQAVSTMKSNAIDCEYVDIEKFINSRELKDVRVVAKSGMETKLFHSGLNMSFMCDGIIRYGGKYYIMELKTETSNKFFMRKEVDPKHYNQATAYSIAFGLNDVIFVYISRDTLDMKSFMFHATDEMKQELTARIMECDNYVKSGKVPPKPVEEGPKLCNYCSYKTLCRKGEFYGNERNISV